MLVTFVQEVMRGVKSGFDVYRLAPNTFKSKMSCAIIPII